MANPSGSNALSRANAAADGNQNGTAVGATKQTCPIFDVIVLVAGTVDPINNDPFKLANSFSGQAKPGKDKALAAIMKEEARLDAEAHKERLKYDNKAHDPRHPDQSQKDSDYYWSGNPLFIDRIVELQKTYDHVYLFRDFGWSGDNCVANREIAGRVLGDWLCGYKMTPAMPSYLNPSPRKVSFHFIGHSHGGNVINEVTKEIAKNSWPNVWKVKSITYLSTPFFQTIHIPVTTKFSGKARICNTFNQYDLTQTAIADFSLRQLTRVTNVVVAAKATLMPMVDRIVKFDATMFNALRVMPKANPYIDHSGPIPMPKVAPTWNMDPTAGHNLYVALVALLADVKLVIAEVKSMVAELNREVFIRISEVFDKKGILTKRKILSDAITAKINALLDTLEASVDRTQKAFQARITSGVYPVRGFMADLYDLLETLYDALNVDPASLGGTLTGLLFDAFKEQIEVFDDTLATCDHLYKGAFPIVPVDVTSWDEYYQKRDPQFYKFKGRLVQAEVAYMGAQTRYNFLHMLFLLAAQLEEIRKYLPEVEKKHKYLGWFVSTWTIFDSSSNFSQRVQEIDDLLTHWLAVFKSRDCGGIVYGAADRDPQVGSVAYLAMVSHSVSHTQLFPDVGTFLRAQFDSHEVKAKR